MDVIAEGVIAAVKDMGSLPLIIEVSRTNVDQGKQMLADSGLAIIPAIISLTLLKRLSQRLKGVTMAVLVDNNTRLVCQGILWCCWWLSR